MWAEPCGRSSCRRSAASGARPKLQALLYSARDLERAPLQNDRRFANVCERSAPLLEDAFVPSELTLDFRDVRRRLHRRLVSDGPDLVALLADSIGKKALAARV